MKYFILFSEFEVAIVASFSAILVYFICQGFIFRKKIKMQTEEIARLNRLYEQNCREVIEPSSNHKGSEITAVPSLSNDQLIVSEQKIKYLIEQHPRLCDKDWELISQYINNTQNLFVEKLTQTYPVLSRDDIRIILLIRLNIPSARIATIFHIQVESLRTRRYRMMKKMKRESEGLTTEFITNLFNDESRSS